MERKAKKRCRDSQLSLFSKSLTSCSFPFSLFLLYSSVSLSPGIMNPVVLMQKTKDGKITPWNWGHRFRDGSLRVDIPLKDLHSLFNVNFPLVSQVNPHVHLFFFAPKGMPGRPVVHRKGKGWRGELNRF